MLKTRDVDLDELLSALPLVPWTPSTNARWTVPAYCSDRLPEVSDESCHNETRERRSDRRGMDRVEMEQRQMVHHQEAFSREEVLNYSHRLVWLAWQCPQYVEGGG